MSIVIFTVFQGYIDFMPFSFSELAFNNPCILDLASMTMWPVAHLVHSWGLQWGSLGVRYRTRCKNGMKQVW